MTTLEKEQYFASHWGLQVACSKIAFKTGSKFMLEKVSAIEFDYIMCLELTPLSKIKDEDALEVAEIAFNDPNRMHMLKIGKHALWNFFEEGYPILNKIWTNEIDQSYGPNELIRVSDYLRSKGYALPWRNFSVDDLIKEGVLKLRS